jgi:hypothetical protein
MNRRQEYYVCTVERGEDGRVLAVVVYARDLEGSERRVRLNGTSAARVAGSLHDVLRNAGVPGRTWASSRPIELDPVTGAHTELLVLAVKPLRRGDRVEAVGEGVGKMSREEASYWHAKSHQPGGLRALRVLLTKGAMR